MLSDRVLEGQYALVTGGTRGIGLAIAGQLAEQGSHVALTSRHIDDCRAAAEGLRSRFSARSLALAADVSSQASVRSIFHELYEWSSNRLDILVCNAGYPFREDIWNTPLHETPGNKLEEWYLGVLRTDTLGSVFCTFEALPAMIRQKGGSILYISSTPALEGFQGSPYTIAKAGILGFMKDVARQYGRYNIRANAFALGNIATAATLDQLDAETRKKLAETAPLQRWGTPDEVGRAALFAVSRLSSFMTGQTLVLDGGAVRW
jgi:3-oxoacyl-[acyl-carrier protein] reductase